MGQISPRFDLISTLCSTFDLELILNDICKLMIKDLDFDKSGVVFLDKSGRKPYQSAYAGFSAEEYRQLLDRFEPLLLPILQEKESRLITGTRAAPEWKELFGALGAASLLLMPLRAASRLIGFIVGARAQRTAPLNRSERELYSTVAAQASIALEHARLYKALEQANLTLEEKVAERTKDLIEANERLRELDRIKSNFLSLISHELRTPLTAIKGFVVTMYHYDKQISDEKRHVYLRVLNQETDRLTSLITDMLDISKIESGQTEMQWKLVSLPQIVRKVFESAQKKAGTVRLAQDFPDDFPAILADPDKLEQVLTHLVGNGARFTPSQRTVTVSGRPDDDMVSIEVKDEGPGIAFSYQERVFDKFFRLDNDVNRKNPGTGLGLPICRALVNLHGGRIWVESDEGQGCRFIFTLPIRQAKRTDDAPASPNASAHAPS